jgi:hypothetical protein
MIRTGILVLLSLTANFAIAADYQGKSRELEVLFSGTVSCDTLAIVEYRDNPWDSSAFTIRSVDKEKCRGVLTSKRIETVFQPFLEFWLQEDTLRNDQTEHAEEKFKSGFQAATKATRQLASPLAELCRLLAQPMSKQVTRVCFFNAPPSSASKEAKAIFRATISNRLPKSESLCTAEGEPVNAQETPEFAAMAPYKHDRISWDAIRTNLEQDGFKCADDSKRPQQCLKTMMQIIYSSEESKRDPSDGGLWQHEWLLSIKFLGLGRDRWLSRDLSCQLNTGDKKPDCTRPQRGARNGICFAPRHANLAAEAMAASILQGIGP